MNNISNLSDTIKPKSDQLNADDLLVSSKTITVSGVSRGNADNPIIVNYQGDDGRPFKPCKSMRRVLIFAWGEDGNNWLGRSMTLYCEPTVKYAGKEVGGIRISHLSDIPKPINLKLTATRGRKADFKVDVLKMAEKPPYPQRKFDDALEAMEKAIKNGSMTPEQVISKCESTGTLTEEQRSTIRGFLNNESNDG